MSKKYKLSHTWQQIIQNTLAPSIEKLKQQALNQFSKAKGTNITQEKKLTTSYNMKTDQLLPVRSRSGNKKPPRKLPMRDELQRTITSLPSIALLRQWVFDLNQNRENPFPGSARYVCRYIYIKKNKLPTIQKVKK